MGIINGVKELKRIENELACYLKFIELQNAKKKGIEVRETKEQTAYRNYLTELITVDKPKKNPIGFC